MKKKWKILLACVVAVTAACAAAWYLLPRPAVGEDYEVQYINVGETLENITGQIDQNTCNALNDLLRQAERRGYRRNVFPRQLREDTVQIIGVDSHGPWFFELDGEACVLCDGQRGGYPIIDGEGLLKQVWALLPEPCQGRDAPVKRKWKILLACVVVVAAVAAMTVGICARYVLHYPAVGGDFEISFIRAGETLEDITEQIDQDTLDAIKGLVLGAERGGTVLAALHGSRRAVWRSTGETVRGYGISIWTRTPP